MLVSLNWLNDYIDLKDLSPQEVSHALTDIGLEVEGIETIGKVPEKVVLGRILSAAKHPDADSLQVCEVDVGEESPLTIVCGAANARKDLTVAVCTVGAVLPGDFKIKKSKIRGQESFGMLASEKELGIAEENEGIMEVETNASLGTHLGEALGLGDVVFDISLTPNRADCLGYIGIARDLGAKLMRPIKIPEINASQFTTTELKSVDHVELSIESDELSKRFTALYVKGVKPSTSPLWMRRRLEASGMRPINTIVDATNYVLLETGQPIHAYDERDVEGNHINVRRGHAGDKLTTLDGAETKLKAGDILICDSQKPIGLAGIMGGENSEVKDDTSAIIIEVAEFDPRQVRKTSKRLAIHTEASHRFERGIDIENIFNVNYRTAQLIYQLARETGQEPPQVAADLIDFYPTPFKRNRIALRLSRAKQILHLPYLSIEICKNHLESLGLELIDNNEERMVFDAPSWRHDMVREIDLIEEVGRIEGFEKIPYELPAMNLKPLAENPLIAFTDNVKTLLASFGSNEVITFPFTSRELYEAMNVNKGHPLFPQMKLANPISEEMGFLQTTLLPELIEAVRRNRNKGQKGSNLFEVARGYFDTANHPFDKEQFELFSAHDRKPDHWSEKTKSEANRPIERNFVAGILDHPYTEKSWNLPEEAPSFFHAKSIIESLLAGIGSHMNFVDLKVPTEADLPFLHPKASAVILNDGKLVGYFGELHPRVALKLGLGSGKVPVVYELDMESLIDLPSGKDSVKGESSKFPPVTRDLAFLVAKDVSHRQFSDTFSKFPEKSHLKDWRVFDCYEDESMGENKKSLAFSLSFQSQDKTLTDKVVDKEVTKLIKWCKDSIGAVQR